MNVKLVEATKDDFPAIVSFLKDMDEELGALDLDEDELKQVVSGSLDDQVHWFLFKDEAGKAFGTCHMQAIFNYWRKKKRFLIAGFYIAPAYRGKGYFNALNKQIDDWAKAHNGLRLYAFIHEDNKKSRQGFESIGMDAKDYMLYSKSLA